MNVLLIWLVAAVAYWGWWRLLTYSYQIPGYWKRYLKQTFDEMRDPIRTLFIGFGVITVLLVIVLTIKAF